MNNRSAKEISITLPQLTLRGFRWGTPDQPLIFALHGWLDNAASFSELAPLLMNYQVVALDFPGHAHSDDLVHTEEYSFINFITIFTQVITQLSNEPIIFMGHSLGGAIANFIAAEFPHLVHHLILIDSMGLLSDKCSAGDSRLARWVNNFYRVETKPQRIYEDRKSMIASRAQIIDVSYDSILQLAERALSEIGESYRWRIDPRLSLKSFSNFTEEQAIALLAAIQLPTLEVEASEGVIVGNELFTKRVAAIKPLQLERLDGPHHIHLTQAQKVAELIERFLKD